MTEEVVLIFDRTKRHQMAVDMVSGHRAAAWDEEEEERRSEGRNRKCP